MGKLIKWLLGLALLLVVLVVAAVIVLPMVVDPNDYKEQIVQVVKDKTGRDLQINKELKLSVFPWLGIETGGVSLSNRKGFGKKPFAQIDQLGLRVKLLPLLSKQIEVDTLVLTGLDLNLKRNKKGKTNWEDLVGEEESAEKAAGKKSSDETAEAVAFKVQGIRLKDARISWNDRQADKKYVLKNVRLVTDNLAPGIKVPVKAGLTFTSSHPSVKLNAELQAGVTANTEFTHYQVDGLQLNLQGSGEGLPEDGMTVGVAADIDLDLTDGLLMVSGLNVQGPDVALDGDLKVANLNTTPHVKGALKLGRTNIKQLAALFGSTIETSDAAALTRVSADLKLDHDGKALKIDPLAIKLDESKVTGFVHLLDTQGPVVRSNIDIDQLDVDRYLPPASEAQPQAEQQPAEAGKDNPFEPLRTLDLVAEATIGQLTVNKLSMQQVKVKVVSKDGVLKAKPIAAKLYQGSFDGSTTLDASGKRPKIHAVKKLAGISIGPLLKDVLGEDRLLGKGSVNLDLKMQGSDERAIRNTLGGTADFKLKNGAVKGVNLAELIRSAEGALGGGGKSATQGTGEGARTDFSEMRGSFNIKRGVISNNDLQAKSPLLRVDGKGKVDLPADTIDYLVTTELVASLEGQGGKGGDQLAGLPIPVRVKGPLTNPSYKPDLSGLLNAKVEQRVEQEKEKLKSKLQEKAGGQLDGKLKGLFGR